MKGDKMKTLKIILPGLVFLLSACKLDGNPQTINQFNSQQPQLPAADIQKFKSGAQKVVNEIKSTNMHTWEYKAQAMSNQGLSSSTQVVNKTRSVMNTELTEVRANKHIQELKNSINQLKNKIK